MKPDQAKLHRKQADTGDRAGIADRALRTYARKAQVPVTADTRAKVCGKCDRWFAAFPRQRTCLPCLPFAKRAKWGAKPIRHGHVVAVESAQVSSAAVALSERLSRGYEPGRKATALERSYASRKKKANPRRLELCAELALEAARRIDERKPTPDWLIRARQRAIAEGRQGECCAQSQATEGDCAQAA